MGMRIWGMGSKVNAEKVANDVVNVIADGVGGHGCRYAGAIGDVGEYLLGLGESKVLKVAVELAVLFVDGEKVKIVVAGDGADGNAVGEASGLEIDNGYEGRVGAGVVEGVGLSVDAAVGKDNEAFVGGEDEVEGRVVFVENGVGACASAILVVNASADEVVVFLVGGVGEGDGIADLECTEVGETGSVANDTVVVGDLDGDEGVVVDGHFAWDLGHGIGGSIGRGGDGDLNSVTLGRAIAGDVGAGGFIVGERMAYGAVDKQSRDGIGDCDIGAIVQAMWPAMGDTGRKNTVGLGEEIDDNDGGAFVGDIDVGGAGTCKKRYGDRSNQSVECTGHNR